MAFNIVLHEPEIPSNTGNIGRTCVATGTHLHLIRPLGFKIDDKKIKRSGMDYWKDLNLTIYDDWDDFLEKNPEARIFYATTKGRNVYSEVEFKDGDFLVFGKESAGIPEEILIKHPNEAIRIPMGRDIRSLNLSNSVAIVLYEALRQNNFMELERKGNLHRLHW